MIRTPFHDEHARRGVADGCRQVVLLAAGFDGRAARLDLPVGTTVFDVDTAAVLDFKAATPDAGGVADSVVQRRTVAVDLRADRPAALRSAGFDPAPPTAWVAEGLLVYLDADQCDRLLDLVTSLSAPGSRIATEWFERNPAGERSVAGASRRWGSLMSVLACFDRQHRGEWGAAFGELFQRHVGVEECL